MKSWTLLIKNPLSSILRYAPIGILFLIAGKIVEMEDISAMGGQLGMYTVTVVCGLLIHAIVVLPTLYFVITRKNPFVFIAGLLQALITALGTSSRYFTGFKCQTLSRSRHNLFSLSYIKDQAYKGVKLRNFTARQTITRKKQIDTNDHKKTSNKRQKTVRLKRKHNSKTVFIEGPMCRISWHLAKRLQIATNSLSHSSTSHPWIFN